jgi:hypothetical protein
MAITNVSIAQTALASIGETGTVASLVAPTTKAEQLAALFFDQTRDRLFNRHNWSWATRRADLVLAASHTRYGWGYCYTLPADLVRVITLDTGYRAAGQAISPSWAIEANNAATGRILCCDISPASLAYVGRIIDPALWSPGFLDAMTSELAFRLTMPLAVKPELAQQALAISRQAWVQAVADDLAEAKPDADPPSDYLAARSW